MATKNPSTDSRKRPVQWGERRLGNSKSSKKVSSPQGTEFSQSSAESTKDQLIQSAKKVFADKGYDGATVSAICEAAGVNNSLVNYHFGSKEGLYRACFEHFSDALLTTIRSILRPAKTAEEFSVRFRMYAESSFQNFVNEPELSILATKETETIHTRVRDIVEEKLFPVFYVLVEFLTEGQKNGFVREDLDPQIAASMIFGGLGQFQRSERISRESGYPSIMQEDFRNRVTDHFVRIYLEGLLLGK